MLILVCLVITLGGGPTHDRVGFRHWRDPGAFVEYRVHASTGRFLGVWAAIVQACFAYTGTEVVGVAFGETPNPRKNVPQAINQTLFRIGFFYVLGALLLGMCIPCNSALLIGATKAKTSAGKHIPRGCKWSRFRSLTLCQLLRPLSLQSRWRRFECYQISSTPFCLSLS